MKDPHPKEMCFNAYARKQVCREFVGILGFDWELKKMLLLKREMGLIVSFSMVIRKDETFAMLAGQKIGGGAYASNPKPRNHASYRWAQNMHVCCPLESQRPRQAENKLPAWFGFEVGKNTAIAVKKVEEQMSDADSNRFTFTIKATRIH
ncbi:hypothetical protein ACLOJK_033265 [Asimina triloba]